MKNSYFLCVTQPNNVGDLLINRMLIEELSLYGHVYVDCYNCPDDFRYFLIGKSDKIIDIYKACGFTLKKGSIFRFIQLIKKSNIKLYTQSPGPLNKIERIHLRFYFTIVRKSLSMLHVPFVRIGNCCSAAIATKTNVVESKDVDYYVRSKNAVDFLKKYKREGVYYIPDLAFLYKKYVRLSDKSKTAVLSFREVRENQDQFFEWLKSCVDLLKKEGFKVILYHQVKDDLAFMEKLYNIIKNIEIRKEIVWFENFDFYADKSVVISNRLHCLLLGAIYNAVPYAYLSHEKLVLKISDVFMSTMGPYASNYLDDSMDIIKLQDILNNLSAHQSIIRKIVDENSKLCSKVISTIMK